MKCTEIIKIAPQDIETTNEYAKECAGGMIYIFTVKSIFLGKDKIFYECTQCKTIKIA